MKNCLIFLIKGITMIVTLLFLSSLFGCNQSKVVDNSENSFNMSSDIFRCFPNDNLTFLSVDDGRIYYSRSVFDAGFYYYAEKTNNRYKSKLFLNDFFSTEKNFLSHLIQPVGSDVFYVKYYGNNGTLHKININTKNKEKLSPQNIYGDWIVFDDKIVFEQNFNNKHLLCYQSFADSDDSVISNNMESFAVCKNKVRYIERKNTDMLSICEFDLENKTTTELGSFEIEDYERDNISFSYGTDCVVFYRADTDKNKKLFVYSISRNKLDEYSLPVGITNICCAENYAFLSSSDDGGVIYRMCLDNGNMKKVCDNRNILALYAINDLSVIGVVSEGDYVYCEISGDGVINKLFQY